MIAPIFRSFLILICLGLFAGHSPAQDSRFPAILVKGPGITLIECDVPRVFDDGTIAFKPIGEGGLEKGVVYAVFMGKQLVTHIQVTEEKGQASLAKPVPGFLSLKGIPKGTKLMLKAVEGGGTAKYVPLRMDELEIDVKVVRIRGSRLLISRS